jgi:hypothetical protein
MNKKWKMTIYANGVSLKRKNNRSTIIKVDDDSYWLEFKRFVGTEEINKRSVVTKTLKNKVNLVGMKFSEEGLIALRDQINAVLQVTSNLIVNKDN